MTEKIGVTKQTMGIQQHYGRKTVENTLRKVLRELSLIGSLFQKH